MNQFSSAHPGFVIKFPTQWGTVAERVVVEPGLKGASTGIFGLVGVVVASGVRTTQTFPFSLALAPALGVAGGQEMNNWIKR